MVSLFGFCRFDEPDQTFDNQAIIGSLPKLIVSPLENMVNICTFGLSDKNKDMIVGLLADACCERLEQFINQVIDTLLPYCQNPSILLVKKKILNMYFFRYFHEFLFIFVFFLDHFSFSGSIKIGGNRSCLERNVHSQQLCASARKVLPLT